MLFTLALFWGCGDSGWIRGPIGRERLLTGFYRVGVGENRPELLLFLSSSNFDGCSLPDFGDDLILTAQANQPTLLALCREGAQHLLVKAYDADGDWTGPFVLDPEAAPSTVGIGTTRVASARYYGIRESIRVRFLDVESYIATSSEILNPLPAGGELTLDSSGPGILTGTYTLEGVLGEFVATECPGDTKLIDTLDEQWVDVFCESQSLR